MLNTRAFKDGDKFIITVGSINTEASKQGLEFKARKFDIQYGEFSPYLQEMNEYLREAKKYCANETQEKMIQHYIDHYISGDVETHKNSQREWVKDKGPVVETNMGWIETYIDPENIRGYFEGMVSIVDKDQSKKF